MKYEKIGDFATLTNDNNIHIAAKSYGYDKNFWNYLYGKAPEDMVQARLVDGTYILPYENQDEYAKELKKESLFRQIGSVFSVDFTLERWVYTDDQAYLCWKPDNNSPSMQDLVTTADTFTKLTIEPKRLIGITRIDYNFLKDMGFNVKSFIIKRFAKVIGEEEEAVFINGDGEKTPLGILASEDGAEIGVTSEFATCLSWEEVYKLFFSVESKYRKHGSWLMNDTTALALRCMKDSSGRFIWNETNDTILGKPVYISNQMPDIGAGAKPIAFGDFSYYCVFEKLSLAMRTLYEVFSPHSQMGYLGSEMVDGRLVRPEAVKVIKMAE